MPRMVAAMTFMRNPALTSNDRVEALLALPIEELWKLLAKPPVVLVQVPVG